MNNFSKDKTLIYRRKNSSLNFLLAQATTVCLFKLFALEDIYDSTFVRES